MRVIKFYCVLCAGALALLTVSCKEQNRRENRADSDDKDVTYTTVSLSGERNMITGEDGDKVWKVRSEFNAAGNREDRTREERREEYHFYQNNTFTIAGPGGSSSGSWSYDGTTLVLHFAGTTVMTKETYTVEELTKNKMRLRAEDGKEVVLADKDLR